MSEEPSSHLFRPPRAGALIEALRDIGYSFESAIADILDNSITAKATVINVSFGWDSASPWLAIVDNGAGMPFDVLLEAMRPGSVSPNEVRSLDDLGRFGLGLKTASFSQCRRLTVVSRTDLGGSALVWDLDHVSETDEWLLQELTDREREALPFEMSKQSAGTAVLWQKIDRLDIGADGPAAHLSFNERMDSVRTHVALIFHRYLEGEPGKPKISIRINGLPVEPFDPFNAKCLATQYLLPEPVPINGETVVLQPYVLPHHSKVSPSEYQRLAGPEGYLRSQGFYVYRNRRLIVHGTWFRLARQEELTKLARVKVDIPNTMDHLWAIDVRKSRAHPPRIVRRRMKQIIEQIRGSARKPYTKRAVIVTERSATPVWLREVSNESVRYRINGEHPLIREFRLDLPELQRKRLDTILTFLASCFPAAVFFSDYATVPQSFELDGSNENILAECVKMISAANPDLDQNQLTALLRSMEPFASRASEDDPS